jgi:hypothetical protein
VRSGGLGKTAGPAGVGYEDLLSPMAALVRQQEGGGVRSGRKGGREGSRRVEVDPFARCAAFTSAYTPAKTWQQTQ